MNKLHITASEEDREKKQEEIDKKIEDNKKERKQDLDKIQVKREEKILENLEPDESEELSDDEEQPEE